MTDTDTTPATATPLWRKIYEFPLVTMLIAIALAIAAMAAARLLIEQVIMPKGDLRTTVRAAVVLMCLFAVYKLAIRRLPEPRDDLPFSGMAKGLGIGLLFGFLLFSAVVGIAALFDVYNIVGVGGTGELVTAIVVMSVMPAVTEELMFRGILFRWLEAFGGSWFALALTSGLFGFAHLFNDNATVFSSFAIAVEAGVLLGGAYMLTRSLWMPIGLHAAWNFTQGEIFDVNVSGNEVNGLVTAKMSGPEILSGGSFGLEASVIALVVATSAGVWLVMWAVRQGALVQPWWVRRRLARASVPAVERAA